MRNREKEKNEVGMSIVTYVFDLMTSIGVKHCVQPNLVIREYEHLPGGPGFDSYRRQTLLYSHNSVRT